MEAIVVGKFQRNANFGFVIPEDRDAYGWDFFIHKDNKELKLTFFEPQNESIITLTQFERESCLGIVI